MKGKFTMAKRILSQQVDVVEVLFNTVENSLTDDTTEVYEVLTKIREVIGGEMFDSLESAIGYRVYKAQRAGFSAGWQMRGQL